VDTVEVVKFAPKLVALWLAVAVAAVAVAAGVPQSLTVVSLAMLGWFIGLVLVVVGSDRILFSMHPTDMRRRVATIAGGFLMLLFLFVCSATLATSVAEFVEWAKV